MTEPVAGLLGLMGSGEFEPWSEEAERVLLSQSSGDGSVAVLPLAHLKARSMPTGRAKDLSTLPP